MSGTRTALWGRGCGPFVACLALLWIVACGVRALGRPGSQVASESSIDGSARTPTDVAVDSMAEAPAAQDAAADVPAPSLPSASSSGVWPYPFGPLTEPSEESIRAKFRKQLERAGGITTAIDCVCTCEGHERYLEDLVATNFLLERADATYPAMLDAMRRLDGVVRKAEEAPATASLEPQKHFDAESPADKALRCRGAIEGTLQAGACWGYDVVPIGPTLDALPLAVERRGRAQHALAKAIEGGGSRAELALDVLLEAGKYNPQLCTGLADTVRTATPILVKWLGAPRRPSMVPGSARNWPELDWERAFRALSLGGPDRAVAEKPVAAFLADDTTAPLAALALARMGADASATVPLLSRILDGLSAAWTAVPYDSSRGADWDQLTQLVDTVDALQAIGKPARSALPSVCSFILRTEVPACRMLHDYKYIQLVRAIATPADAQQAATCLAPLLVCPGNKDLVVQALGEFGASARAPLLSMLRDNGRTIGERLEAAAALQHTEQADLDDRDRHLFALLRAKSTALNDLRAAHYPTEAAKAELQRCGAEAGLTIAPALAGSHWWDFANCLSTYLCGPTAETYARTMGRCCASIPRPELPAFCVGLSDAGATTAAPGRPY